VGNWEGRGCVDINGNWEDCTTINIRDFFVVDNFIIPYKEASHYVEENCSFTGMEDSFFFRLVLHTLDCFWFQNWNKLWSD